MKFISNRVHGVLDYISVVFLMLSPFFFEISDPAMYFTWSLAFVHLLLTLTTDFELGIFRIISCKMHGRIELLVAFGLAGVAIYFRVTGDMLSYWFYMVFAVILFLLGRFSMYTMPVKTEQLPDKAGI